MTQLHSRHASVLRSIGLLQAVPFRGTHVDVVAPGPRRHLAFSYLLLVEQFRAATAPFRHRPDAGGSAVTTAPPAAAAQG